jgi:hypothetical protein
MWSFLNRFMPLYASGFSNSLVLNVLQKSDAQLKKLLI